MERQVHLGQTASFLANVLNRNEPTSIKLSRNLRENGWTVKGGRGLQAPHISATELAHFLIAFMASPDSPSLAVERLEHFSTLSREQEASPRPTFGEAVAILLARLAEETWEAASAMDWVVSMRVDISAASICTDINENNNSYEEHFFSALVGASDHAPLKEVLPYYGGLHQRSEITCLTLFRIAKVVLAGESDPLNDIAKLELEGEE